MDRPSHTVILLSENVARLVLRGESYLSRSGFVLIVGGNGRNLLDLASRQRPSAAIIGSDFADLPGHEACRRLKRSLDPPPAVLIVGPEKPSDARRCREAGCDEYIASPLQPQALLIPLASHLGVRMRLETRRPLVVPVSYGRVIREFLGYTRDLGAGGALIETVLKPGIGRRLLLRLYPDDREALVLTAVILRIQVKQAEGQNLAGAQFLPETAGARARLKALVEGRI